MAPETPKRPPPRAQSSDDVAVAIADDAKLPRVTAAGRGALAREIVELAFAHGVEVRTDAALAEMLAAVESESEIPLAALAAVAEVLSYVYRAEASSEVLRGTP